MNNNLIAGLVIVGAVLLSSFLFKPDVNVTVNPEPPFGAVSTNAPTEPFYFQGGSTGKTVGFISTTTVVAFIQNPSNATTTFTARFLSNATSTATNLVIATSTNAGRYATTTAILGAQIASGEAGAGSYVGANNQNLLGPGEWVQLGYGAGTTLYSTANYQTGTFSVSFLNIK